MAKIAEMFESGKSVEEVAAAIKEQAAPVEHTPTTAAEVGQSMDEQDVSTVESLAADLRSDYLQGNITPEQYADVFSALSA